MKDASKARIPGDFVNHLQQQLDLLREGRFQELDLETVVDEFEGVVGEYRSEVEKRLRKLIPILMRKHDVYGDWNDLRFHMSMIRFALRGSPSLAKVSGEEIREAYEFTRVEAELHGETGWPEDCPWATLKGFFVAVAECDERYVRLEQEGNDNFLGLRGPVPRGDVIDRLEGIMAEQAVLLARLDSLTAKCARDEAQIADLRQRLGRDK